MRYFSIRDVLGELVDPYERPFSSANPGCLIILLDQSATRGVREATAISIQVNKMLGDLGIHCLKYDGTEMYVSPRFLVGLYGYSGAGINWAAPELNPTQHQGLVSIAKLSDIQTFEFDEDGSSYPIVVPEQAFGSAPIVQALEKAREIAASFALSHPNSFPPFVLNITAGDFGDLDERDFLSACLDITKVSTAQGATLVAHSKVSSQSETTAFFPTSPEGLDASSNLLFRASSVIPEPPFRNLKSWGFELGNYPRLFTHNMSLEWLPKFFWLNPEALARFD